MLINPQGYPRINDESNPYDGCLNDEELVPHTRKLSQASFAKLVQAAINDANKKSSRTILVLLLTQMQVTKKSMQPIVKKERHSSAILEDIVAILLLRHIKLLAKRTKK